MKYGNCLIWAIYQKIKFGGTLIFMPSERFGVKIKGVFIPLLFHVIWESPTKRKWTYTPICFLNSDSSGLNWIIFYRGIPIRFLKKEDSEYDKN